MKTFITIFLLLTTTISSYALVTKPIESLTPGDYCTVESKDFLEIRYAEKVAVCKRNVSSSLKSKVFSAYKVPFNERALYTIDHKVSLFLGGSNNIKNLWPQPISNSSAKLENHTFILLKGGKITLKKATDLVLSVKK